ncbi:MAG TPA: hypothetical protein VGD99_10600 [Anaerolineae bacterium]
MNWGGCARLTDRGPSIQDMMPGLEAITGSLGQGLSAGLSHVLVRMT